MSAQKIEPTQQKENMSEDNRLSPTKLSKHSLSSPEKQKASDCDGIKGDSIEAGSDSIGSDQQPSLKKIKSAEELKIDFHQNQKMLSSLSFNINDLFKKINSLAEQVENQVQANPISAISSMKQIPVSPSKNSQWKSEHLIKEIQKQKQEFIKMNQQIMKVPLVEDNGISMKMFEVGKNIGHGKFGQVVHCRHRETGMLYALKKVFKSTIDKYEMHQQILIQLEACKRMNHPNIIKTYTAFTDQFHIFILSELAQGEKLVKKFNSSQGYISRIIKQVLDALAYIHQNQVVHRDLKPENIMVSEHGIIKVCDFGWSSLIDNEQNMDIICGTLDYVCPEMVEKQKYSKQVDLWSVGVLVYELLYGEAPFKAQTREQTFNKVKKIEFIFPEGKEISEQCKDFINRLLQPQRSRMRLNECMSHPFITKYPSLQATNAFQFDNLFE